MKGNKILFTFKKASIKLSLVSVMVILPFSLHSASVAGFSDGSSESTSAMIESPNVEQQINRVDVGISLVRANTVILYDMPISGDSTWVDELTKPMTTSMYNKVKNSSTVKNDPYFSTVQITNAILGRLSLGLTPINARLYLILNTIYKNDTNVPKKEKGKYNIPDIYALPSFDNMDSFTHFPLKNNGKKVELIKVNASKFELYKNAETAVISLAPKKYQEKLNNAKDEYLNAKDLVAEAKGVIESNEAWLDENKNSNSPKRAKYEEKVKIKKVELDKLENKLDEADDIYTKLMKEATLAIESNIQSDFITTKVPLAKKLEKLLDTVDNNAISAGSMFSAAFISLGKNGLGTLRDELRAITIAQSLSTLVGNQKDFLSLRFERMGKGALMLIPNISIGTYYAIKQSSEAGRYQIIVDKVLEIGKAQEEADKERQKENKIKDN